MGLGNLYSYPIEKLSKKSFQAFYCTSILILRGSLLLTQNVLDSWWVKGLQIEWKWSHFPCPALVSRCCPPSLNLENNVLIFLGKAFESYSMVTSFSICLHLLYRLSESLFYERKLQWIFSHLIFPSRFYRIFISL